MSREWMVVDPARFAEHKKENVAGVDVTLTVSPYDVPDGIRALFDESLSRLVIEFRYLGLEPYKRVRQSKFVTLRLGRHSERLYGVEVDVNGAGAQWVALTIKAIEEQVGEPRKARGTRFNYDIAKELLREKATLLQRATATG